ncbi:MAG: nitrilase-related carbon-nitrogen hydrolase [Actinomycetota bacterium]|nr:nitrilase-related carbon-nitrogen hydrolase [Actinomycetota bacterium]MEC9394930.1 nitrilase-related carbon-nitrogen hydrolase [Actinomycetota bacterium]MED6327411.1 nitrilase-related carbon-nitrogen hydrolase [Actinomycetota bacterium]MEE2958878.1 nitrilase-related carbon-nitrogen hydrolase [Actinomycetota bacterium]
MRVAGLQHDIMWEEPLATCAHVTPMIAEAVDSGADMVLLTEMFATGFSLAAERIAEPPGGPTEAFLADQAVEHGVWMGGSIPTLDPAIGDGRPVNRFLLVGPDGTRHAYDKLHPFSFADEHLAYAAGDRTMTLVIDGVRFSLFTCYDLRFADAFWGLAHDTDAYLVVANWPESRRHHWRTLLRARAIENQAWVVGVNRVGEGNGLAYSGDTVIVDPLGEAVAEGIDHTEGVVLADVDPVVVTDVRDRFRFLPDRRS